MLTHSTHDISPEVEAYWRARWAKKRGLIEQGMGDLALWLEDQATVGVEQLRRGGPEPVKAIASRMLNVECKGIAERLERLVELLGGEGRAQWEYAERAPEQGIEERLDAQLLALGELALLSRGFERLERLSFEQRVSLLAQIGLREEPKAVRQKEPLEGRWVALSQRRSRERGLLVRRQWLARLPSLSSAELLLTRGDPSEPELLAQRASLALVIDYAWGAAPLPPQAPIGGVVRQPLRSFEGLSPRRVLIHPVGDEDIAGSAERPHLITRERPSAEEWAGLLWSQSLAHSRAGFEDLICEAPWLERAPALITGGRLIMSPQGLLSYLDARGDHVPLLLNIDRAWAADRARALLCVGGRGPVSLVGEWSPEGLSALTLISETGATFPALGGKVA